MTCMVGRVMVGAALLLLTAALADAFYLPGVAPTDYSIGSPMNVKVCKLASCLPLSLARSAPHAEVCLLPTRRAPHCCKLQIH